MEGSLTKKERRALAKDEKARERDKNAQAGKLKKLLIWAVILITLGFLGYKAFNFFASSAPSAPATSNIADSDWVKGDRQAKVVLIEFGDFQCPACGNYYPLVGQLETDFGADLAVVWRHFPLTTIHKNAFSAAKAAEAAGRQGKFWEMYDKLFEHQTDWSELSNPESTFSGYAEELSLNKDQFLGDYRGKDVEGKILADMSLGNTLRVNATPTFFVNGKKITNPASYDEFKNIIQDAINQ